MRGIVIVGHGELPVAMKKSAQMIVGEMPNLYALSLEPEDGKEEFAEKLAVLAKELEQYETLIIFSDLLGGSPNNAVIQKYADYSSVEIITGVNLPMVLTATLGDPSILEILESGQQGIQEINQLVERQPRMKPVKKTRPLATTKKDGAPYQIANVRIDARGIHGQVATAWVPNLKVNRIIVIDDFVVKDEMQKTALKMAKPNSIKLSILSSKKAVERLKDNTAYPDEKLLIIRQRVDTLEALAENDFIFKEVNMGNVPNRPNTTNYRKTVNLTDSETAIIKSLIKKGTHFTAQMVPNDAKANFDEIINK